MAPIRRYLRITKYSVLEVRIYLHKPSDASWLLSSRDNVLSRIIQEVRPKVLPKLREENENARKKGAKGKKKKGIKDVASQDDFEVAIFLKETSTRHSLLTKQKDFADKPKLKSNGKNLTGWLNSNENPITITDDAQAPTVLQEDADDNPVELHNIPEATTTGKRKTPAEDGDEDDDALFVSSSDEEFFTTQRAQPSTKRRKVSRPSKPAEEEVELEEPLDQDDDKKKLMLDTSYDGFSIYGRILCLIVTRKGKRDAHPGGPSVGGSQMMEQWVSTQAANEAGIGEDDEG